MNNENTDVDLNEELPGDVSLSKAFSSTEKVKVTVIDENERLKLGKWTLLFIGFICASVFYAYAKEPENKAIAEIFEFLKIGALPLITLIISFYFPKSK